ncbi:MAG: peptidoglycan-binding protein, partial [Rhodobacteraceae bacterium]|nr:peptidoglycan-binding protein [Paracoccaceae bacterium]
MKNILTHLGLSMAAGVLLAACGMVNDPVSRNETTLITIPGDGPPDAQPGACYGKDVTPAVIEVVTEQLLVQPAQIASDGAIIHPAVYKNSTHQAIVQPREEFFFEVPCTNVLTSEFITSL